MPYDSNMSEGSGVHSRSSIQRKRTRRHCSETPKKGHKHNGTAAAMDQPSQFAVRQRNQHNDKNLEHNGSSPLQTPTMSQRLQASYASTDFIVVVTCRGFAIMAPLVGLAA